MGAPEIRVRFNGKEWYYWPMNIRHEGRDYYRTGKTGTDKKTGEPCAEYAPMGPRIWLTQSGIVQPEAP